MMARNVSKTHFIAHENLQITIKNVLSNQSQGEHGKIGMKSCVYRVTKSLQEKGIQPVYGRMKSDDLAPTITTQFNNLGSGRFGHPEQHRALSLREGALLQTFPKDYKFVEPDSPITVSRIAAYIGNAVPVQLAKVIGESIQKHVKENANGGT